MARCDRESARVQTARTLRHCRLFEGLSAVDLRHVAGFTALRRLDPGDYLFHEGSLAQGLFVVQNGAIKVHRVNPLGKEQVLHVFRAPESFGEESLLSGYGYPADASATEPSQVLLVRRGGFLALLRRRPELAMALLRAMDRQVHILIRLLDDLTLKDVKTRFANWLLQNCPDPASREPVCIRLPMTKRVLAAELGTVSETLSRTVAKFRELELLRVEGPTVTLLDPSRLTRLIGAAPPDGAAGAFWARPRSN